MLYFDLNTKNHQWLKPEVPMQMFTVNTNIQLASDWIKIEVSSQEDDNHNWNALDLKGKLKNIYYFKPLIGRLTQLLRDCYQ